MSSHVHDAKVFVPRAAGRPHLVIALDAALDWAFKVVAAYRRHHAAQRLQHQITRDVAAARREAYAMMRDDPRMAADLLAAADRHEADALPDGVTNR
jgi:hypothetical protein